MGKLLRRLRRDCSQDRCARDRPVAVNDREAHAALGSVTVVGHEDPQARAVHERDLAKIGDHQPEFHSFRIRWSRAAYN
jgi:hypothetical protein